MKQRVALCLIGVVLGSLWSLQARGYGLELAPRPESGILPFAAGLLLVGASLGACTHAAFDPAAYALASSWPVGSARARVLTMAALIVAYALLVTRVGYVPATLVLTAAATQIMGMRSWVGSAATSLALVLSSVFIFIYLLRVPLPTPWLAGI